MRPSHGCDPKGPDRMFRRLLPSMFHRRLALLLVGFGVLCTGLGAQVARLTVFEHERHAAEAERKLVRQRWTPTLRGSILDRKGRVLAEDRASYAIAVDYAVLSGEWSQRLARDLARRRHAERWRSWGDAQREQVVERYRSALERHVEAMLGVVAERTSASVEQLGDRRRRIVETIRARHGSLESARVRRALGSAVVRGRSLTPELRSRIARRAAEPILEQTQPHVLVSRIPDALAFELRRLAEIESELEVLPGEPPVRVPLLPGLSVRETTDRHYPFESMHVELDRSTLPGPIAENSTQWLEVAGVANHVVGLMRKRVFATDEAARAEFLRADPERAARAGGTRGGDRGAYRPGDSVGHLGVEASMEHRLRGLRGVQLEDLASGRREEVPPSRGEDVRLSLDVRLQARVQAAMDPRFGLARVQPWQGELAEATPIGTPLNGAAVVLDIATGDILAMVSTPTFTRRQWAEDSESILDDEIDAPHRNRAIASMYPPGSVAKALILIEAHRQGVWSLSEHIACTGHLLEGKPDRLRCWIFKQYPGVTHSMTLGRDLGGAEALMTSCNVFFFDLGRRLGPRGVAEAYRRFGVGRTFALGVGYEAGGWVGWRDDDDSLTVGDAIQMGIGQGPVAWSPLHAADALATIVRRGVRLPPRLLLEGPPRPAERIDIDARARDEALAGLRRVIADATNGTAEHLTLPDGTREKIFNTPPTVGLWGKTGTATAPVQFIDADGNGRLGRGERIVRQGDHSWFVVLAGADEPRYAIVVLMEYGGSGAKVSGPIANQIVHALIDEGYLPRAAG